MTKVKEGDNLGNYNDELMHYGILGMKWGVRRGKNASGKRKTSKKLTADQKERQSRKNDLKKRRTMSDADLKKRIERMKLEKELKNLTQEDIAPGKKYVGEIMSSAGKKALGVVAAGAMVYGVRVAMTKQFDIKEAANFIAANPNKKK